MPSKDRSLEPGSALRMAAMNFCTSGSKWRVISTWPHSGELLTSATSAKKAFQPGPATLGAVKQRVGEGVDDVLE